MAVPTFAIGTASGVGNADATPVLPSHQTGDWLYVDCETVNGENVTCPTTGWAQALDSPQGAAAGTQSSQLTTFCKLAASGAETNPVIQGVTNHKYAIPWRIRGAKATGEGVDVTSGGNGGVTADTTVSITGETTTGADRLIVNSCSRGFDSAAAQFNADAADAALANLAEVHDAGTIQGNGGGIGIWTGEKATAGAYGPMTVTLANASGQAFISRAFEPAAGGVTGTVAVTQADQTSTASGTETLTATSAQTQAAQTSTASGSVVGPFIGTVAVTQANQTSTATAVEGFTGTAAAAQADQSSTAGGLETITGTSAATQADQTAIATGVFGSAVSGTVATTQADQSSTATGSVVVIISGTAAVTQDSQTSTATAVETYTGSSATIQDDQVGLAVGGYDYFATSAITQDSQTSAASGIVAMAVTGTVAVTQQDQFSTATANGGTVTFWVPQPVGYVFNPAAYVANPAAYVKVGPGDIPPAW